MCYAVSQSSGIPIGNIAFSVLCCMQVQNADLSPFNTSVQGAGKGTFQKGPRSQIGHSSSLLVLFLT